MMNKYLVLALAFFAAVLNTQAASNDDLSFQQLFIKPAIIAGLATYGWNKVAPYRKKLIESYLNSEKAEHYDAILDKIVKVGVVAKPWLRVGLIATTAAIFNYRFKKTKDAGIGYAMTATAILTMFQAMFAALESGAYFTGGSIGQWVSERY